MIFLVERSPEPVSRIDLLTDVWQYSAASPSRTVENTIRRLRTKVERDPSAPVHLITSRGEGYAWKARAERIQMPVGQVALVHLRFDPPGVGAEPIDRLLAELLPGDATLFDDEGALRGVAFQTASQALSWTLALQRALLEVSWPREIDGLAGTERVETVDGRVLYRGPRLAAAITLARHAQPPSYACSERTHAEVLSAAAVPGEVLLTGGAWSGAILSAPLDLDAAVQPVRRLPRDPRPLYAAAPSSLRDRLTGVLPPADLPVVELVGRDRSVRDLAARLAREERLVTLVGAPGVGKTAVAAAVASEAGSGFSRVRFCALGGCRTVADVEHEIARQLDAPGGAVSHLVADGEPTLLVLDNVEQLPPPFVDAVQAWLAAGPGLQVLLTSRRALGVAGESVVLLEPLQPREAASLFVRRAEAVRSGSFRSDRELTAVRELVALLDGLPLALNLAAARTATLSVPALTRQLQGHGSATGWVAELDRAITWSWSLLGEEERRALVAASAFRGPFSTDAARAVLGPGAIGALDALAAHHLLTRAGGDALRVFDSVRRFIRSRPEVARELRAAELRHGSYFATRAEYWSQTWDLGALAEARPELSAACSRLRHVAPDVVARILVARHPEFDTMGGDPAAEETLATLAGEALDEATRCRLQLVRCVMLWDGRTDEAARLAVELMEAVRRLEDRAVSQELRVTHGNSLRVIGRPHEAVAILQEVVDELAQGPPSSLQSRALMRLSAAEIVASKLDGAVAHARRALQVAKALGEPRLVAIALDRLGAALFHHGHIAEAAVALLEALRTHEQSDGRGVLLAAVLNNLANSEQRLGHLDRAAAHYRRAIAESRGYGAREAEYQTNLATLQYHRGRPQAALQLYASALTAHEDPSFVLMVHLNRAGVYQELGRMDEALADCDAALELADRGGQLWAYALANRASLLHEAGDVEAAAAGYRRALEALQALPDRYGAAIVSARLFAATGDAVASAALATELEDVALDPDLQVAFDLWRRLAEGAAAPEELDDGPGPESRLALRLLAATP